MMTYKIVSDSSCNMFSLEHIPFENVPMKIRTDNKEYVDDTKLDKVGMMNDNAVQGQIRYCLPERRRMAGCFWR